MTNKDTKCGAFGHRTFAGKCLDCGAINEPIGYAALVRKFEQFDEMTTSDAQGCADVYFRDHAEWKPACNACGDTGMTYMYESPCMCAAGFALIDRANVDETGQL